MMTDAQRKLAGDNHNLIYKVLQDYKLSVEDYYDIAAIGLCKAALHYDESRGVRFSTYAMRCMSSEIQREFGRHKTQMRSGYTVSLDEPIKSLRGDGEPVPLSECLSVDDNTEDMIIFNDVMNMDGLNDKEKRVAKLILSGYSLGDISRNDGISKQAVQQTYARARAKIIRRYA